MSFQSLDKSMDFPTQREMISIKVDEDLYNLRGLSPNRLRFEIEYSLERGSTANSFLFKSNNLNESSILIHPPGNAYKDVYLEKLLKALPIESTTLKIIIGHVNPNRVALLKELVNLYSKIQFICSTPGAKLLKELWNQQKPSSSEKNQNSQSKTLPLPEIQLIQKQQRVSICNGKNLLLIPAPTARWPGGLLAFQENLGLLLSDKFFAAHLYTKQWSERSPKDTEEDRRYYFDCLMAPMANQVSAIAEKLEELDICTIAPGHGPAIEGSWRSLLNNYQRWGVSQQHDSIKVILLFASAYGNTAAIADALANGVNRTGIRIESINCEFTTSKQLIESIQKADAYLIGSPTLGGHAPTPIVSALGALLAEGDRKNPIGIFGSYGWSGEAIDLLENKLRDGGFKFAFDPIKIQFSPNSATLKSIEETGTLLGRNLLKAKTREKNRTAGGMHASRSDPAIIALGRIVGSLCILTASKASGDKKINGAMIASWISQASFSPPGISIAVAKDRAVEALLHQDDYFAINVMSVGKEKELMRKFLKPFPPGANRFEGITIDMSPNEQPVLPEALAWLECSVKKRMECGDHWLIYAEIMHGKLLDPNGTTAIHHRRSGATY